MSKHKLVASYYDFFTKEYKDEIAIQIPGIDLSTVQAIDAFTANHTKDEILKILEDTGIKGKNHLAVVYQNKYHYRAIINEPNFFPCTKILPEQKAIKTWFRGKVISLMMIPNKEIIPLYQEELEYLQNILRNNERDTYEELKKNLKSTNLSDALNWYFEASFDNETDMQEARRKIEQIFSNYTDFRAWYIARTKQKNNEKSTTNYNLNSSYGQSTSSQVTRKKEQEKPSSCLEPFYTYSFNPNSPNSSYQQEEYFSPEELEGMYGFEEDRRLLENWRTKGKKPINKRGD